VHEITVALALLDSVQEAAFEQGIEQVKAVHVRVGAFSGVVRDALLFSWDVATAETVAAGSTLVVEDIPLVVFCERCSGERSPLPGTGLLCPECKTPSPQIVRGREMQLVAMEVPA
jgi:hydrogenase nickel incorporation protein HypA/HybF